MKISEIVSSLAAALVGLMLVASLVSLAGQNVLYDEDDKSVSIYPDEVVTSYIVGGALRYATDKTTFPFEGLRMGPIGPLNGDFVVDSVAFVNLSGLQEKRVFLCRLVIDTDIRKE